MWGIAFVPYDVLDKTLEEKEDQRMPPMSRD
jgi:hypothetical protein